MADIEITAYWESALGVPLTSPANAPTIRIRRLDTNALVVTDAAMTEVGDGNYKYIFTPGVDGIDYVARGDGDPTAAGQVPAGIRYQTDSFNNKEEELWQNEGLDPNNSKVIEEITEGSDYDEDVAGMHKDVTKVGTTTTIDRT